MPEETALARVSEPKSLQSAKQTRLAAFTPVNLTEAIALAKMMAGSDVVPKDYKGKAANILVAIQFGSEIGLAPMQSLQSIAVINGRPSLWGDGALALVQGHQDFEDIQETTEGTIAKCVIKRKGRSAVVRTFSDADAQQAGLLTKGGPWTQYRGRMRQMRARGFALRDSFADVLKGISIAEEAMDMPVDSSPAKQRREETMLDVSVLTPSDEGNRGHNDTGLERKQPDKKPEPTMCGKCGVIDGHEEGCADAARSEQDAKTSKPTRKGAFLVLAVQKKQKTDKSKAPYLVLEVVDNDNHNGKLYVWHQSMHVHLASLKDVTILVEISEQKTGDKTYHQIEHILEIGGKAFVDDAPAEQAEMPTEDGF